MATSVERMRALRERQRRGLRRLTIDVSEDDLRAIAKRGYEGAVTSDIRGRIGAKAQRQREASCRTAPKSRGAPPKF
jgi:hypothetical protein